jgi:hypothetical protein
MLRYLDLKPSSWSQSIRFYPDRDSRKTREGTALTTTVRAVASKLALKNGLSLDDYDIRPSILEGQFPPDEFERANFTPDAFGGLWYVGHVHG